MNCSFLGALVTSDVKRILDAVRGRMCCLPIAAATYLCSYMRTAPQEMLKPMNMVQQLLTMPTTEDDSIRYDLMTMPSTNIIHNAFQLYYQSVQYHVFIQLYFMVSFFAI